MIQKPGNQYFHRQPAARALPEYQKIIYPQLPPAIPSETHQTISTPLVIADMTELLPAMAVVTGEALVQP